jgi:hypothetical protein
MYVELYHQSIVLSHSRWDISEMDYRLIISNNAAERYRIIDYNELITCFLDEL